MGRPVDGRRVPVEAHCTVRSKTVDGMPTVSAHCSTSATWLCRATSAGVCSAEPTTADPSTSTPSKPTLA